MDIKDYVGIQTYAKTGSEVDTFPYTASDLKKDNPLVSFPTGALEKEHIRSEYGVTLVTRIDNPEAKDIPDGKVCKRVFENRDDGWVDAWEYRDMTEEERVSVAIDARKLEYGSVEEQIEHITENGLDSWQTKVADIKARHPK
ncbi:MAG: hypothetical protein QF535_18685 [Anaerolineales bacterium]|nr:hypothetical protein [Anaerolineales bacterium]|tara:strand:- start:826 stop:1254 length:429 start_codon:yes stop_codon:yes gene_type:complete